MVKNTTGGGRTKGLARKHQKTGGGNGHVRIPECDGEEIAIVSKMYGNGMCEIYTNNNDKLIGHIRNKFRGRQKRHNKIEPGQIVLIGLREWESVKKNCDILTLYDDNEVNQLKIKPDIKMENVLKIQQQNSIGTSSNEFASEVDFNCEEDDEIIPSQLKKEAVTTFELETGDAIDFDDI